MNREEPSTYTTLESCDYLVELREHNDDGGGKYYYDSSDWKIREEFPFLNRNSCSGLRRAFWIPFIPDPCETSSCVLLERRSGGGDGGSVDRDGGGNVPHKEL